MPFSLRCYISGLVLAAVVTIALLPLSTTDYAQLSAFCVLVVVAERLSRVRIGSSGWTMSISLVVTLITVLILAPPAAALVGLVTASTAPRSATWSWTKQIVNCGMMSLIPAAGAAVCYLTGGHRKGHFLSFPEFLWPFAASVTTCLVINELIIAGYVALSSRARFRDVLRGDVKRATMPYYSSAVLALIFLSLWNDIGWYTAPLVVVPMYIAHWSLSQYAQEESAHEGTIAALVQAVEIKDSYTRGHSERVALGAEMLARQLKMPQERVAMLRFAGLLHDIGKLGVPTRLLTSTGGLTEEEFKLLCLHPNHGVAVLRDIRFLTEVYEGVLYHHERLDGRGYPTGKSGDEIPEFARIIGVADAFDAMTSTRSYRAARSVEEAVAELRRGAGTQFDPDLVGAFERALELAEAAGRPWVPTELLPAEPPADETAAVPTGPWPLPKRVPGFSFADHDDPFIPAEWFSDWYPSWLAEAWQAREDGDAPDPDGHGHPPTGPGGGIPGQRVGAHESDEHDPREDLDDGWSARMHSAVVREPGPEPEEGPSRRWEGPGKAEWWPAEAAPGSDDDDGPHREPGSGPQDGPAQLWERAGKAEWWPGEEASESAEDDGPVDVPAGEPVRLRDVSADPHRTLRGSMRVRGVVPRLDVEARSSLAEPESSGGSTDHSGSSWFSRGSFAEPAGPNIVAEPVVSAERAEPVASAEPAGPAEAHDPDAQSTAQGSPDSEGSAA